MNTIGIRSCLVLVTLMIGLFTSVVFAGECDNCFCKGKDTIDSCVKCCKPSMNVLDLKISKDGKSIVDQNNNEIAVFSENINVDNVSKSLQGCMCCKKECIVYDKNGDCIKEYNSCTWDFNCSCKK